MRWRVCCWRRLRPWGSRYRCVSRSRRKRIVIIMLRRMIKRIIRQMNCLKVQIKYSELKTAATQEWNDNNPPADKHSSPKDNTSTTIIIIMTYQNPTKRNPYITLIVPTNYLLSPLMKLVHSIITQISSHKTLVPLTKGRWLICSNNLCYQVHKKEAVCVARL